MSLNRSVTSRNTAKAAYGVPPPPSTLEVPVLPAAWRPALPGDKLHKITTLLDNPQPDAIYRRLVSQWDAPDEVAASGREPRGPLWDPTIDPQATRDEFLRGYWQKKPLLIRAATAEISRRRFSEGIAAQLPIGAPTAMLVPLTATVR